MSDFVRRIVSGNKARFKDANLNLELDLVYVTDHVIIMGFPAAGVEGLYRNRREDAKKFLEHRHGKNFWIFNFCPLRENSYPAEFFDGRVSRYPFPDHHAPPLAILPLAAREIRQWLDGSPERVAVLHCKAGKGRSGTLACAFLLSLDDSPSPPKLQRSLTNKEWAKARADQLMETVETEDMFETVREDEETRLTEEKMPLTPMSEFSDRKFISPQSDVKEDPLLPTDNKMQAQMLDKPASETPRSMSPLSETPSGTSNTQSASTRKKTSNLDDVLALHTSRRMKAPSSSSKKAKQGVSIPSQRRWLYYWSLVLAHEAPRDFWSSPRTAPSRKVRLRQITVRMRELKGVKMNLLKLANTVIERTNAAKVSAQDHGKSQVWISLARYNDEFVGLLERWEQHSREESGVMGKRRKGSDHMDEMALSQFFADGKWDQSKMIRSFTRLGDVNGTVVRDDPDKNTRIVTHTLRPLSDRKWQTIEEEIRKDAKNEKGQGGLLPEKDVQSTASSVMDLAQPIEDDSDEGIVLDAEREVRAKIYMGQVFMGWLWFIPTFHMPQPPPTSVSQQSHTTHFLLARKELDFALGAGASIIDVDIALDWILSKDAKGVRMEPPPTQTSLDSVEGKGGEPGGIVAGLQTAVAGGRVGEAVEVVEATNQ